MCFGGIGGLTASAADENDTNLYAYLTGTDHTVTIGTGDSAVTTKYKFYTDKFLPVPTASDFDFTAPGDLKYTREAKQAIVKWKSGITGGGAITVKYYNSNDTEVTQGVNFVPGDYTVKIEVAKGTNYAEATLSDDAWKFTITEGDLTASGTGKASGTYGAKLSELTVSGFTVMLGSNQISGTWSLSGTDVPNVGDTGTYEATFTPAENAAYYNELTKNVTLDIAQANAPRIADIPVSYNWAATGEKTVTVSGLPDDMGTVGAATFVVTDTNDILDDNSVGNSTEEWAYRDVRPFQLVEKVDFTGWREALRF